MIANLQKIYWRRKWERWVQSSPSSLSSPRPPSNGSKLDTDGYALDYGVFFVFVGAVTAFESYTFNGMAHFAIADKCNFHSIKIFPANLIKILLLSPAPIIKFIKNYFSFLSEVLGVIGVFVEGWLWFCVR